MSGIPFVTVRRVAAVVIVGSLLSLAALKVREAMEDARRSQCSSNLKQISLALLNYHDHYGSLPPVAVYDEQGTPMHSWRVLILPYLGWEDLWQRYDLSEPWNGPNNRALAETVQERHFFIYGCPSDPRATPAGDGVSFVAVTGAETYWPEDGTPVVLDAGDADGWLVVEVANSGIDWMEPRDLSLQDALDHFGEQGRGISSAHATIFHALTANSRIDRVEKSTSRAELERRLTRRKPLP